MAYELVPGMAEKIEERRLELGLTIEDLVRETGLTRQGIQRVRRGERRNYQDRLKVPIARVFRWRADAIDLLLAGKSPVELEPGVEDFETRLAEINSEVARLSAELERLRAQLPHATPERPA